MNSRHQIQILIMHEKLTYSNIISIDIHFEINYFISFKLNF